MHFDLETKNDEIAIDVALAEEPTGMSEESGRGWITEEAFFTVSPGWEQMRQRKEVKMNHLPLAEKCEFLSGRPCSRAKQPGYYLRKKRFKLEHACRIVRWTLAGYALGSQTKAGHRDRAKARLIIEGFTDPDLLNIESHSSALTREGFMTVLQSVCSHEHKLHFGYVQQTSNTGDLIKRGQPLFVRMPPDGIPGESREVWVQLFKKVHGLADDTRKWRNVFLATAIGFETSVLEPCVLVLRDSQQRYHGILGMANSDISGGGHEVREQAISELKQRFTFGRWEVGNREVVQAADGSMRVGQPVFFKSLDFVPLGKMRKEQQGDANETEKAAMRSVLGTLGYSARESRPDLSGRVSVLQRRLSRAQVSDIQETNRVVRLAKAHTDLPLLVCRIPVDQICLVSYGDASGGGIHAEQAQTGYVIMFADMSLLAGLASLVTPVSWRSHSVKRFVASASAAEIMGLSEAFAQGGWVRALWSEVVLGLSPHEWRGRKEVTPLISVTDSKGSYDHLRSGTVSPSEDRRSVIGLAIIRENLSRPRMFLRWIDGKAQVADAPARLHGNGDLLRAVCQQAFTELVEASKITTASRQEKREQERVPRVKSPLKLREPVDEMSILVTPMPTVT